MNKYVFFLLTLTLGYRVHVNAQVQNCNLTLSGKILDRVTSHKLSYSTIYIKETEQGTISDSTGHFVIDNICAGSYHIAISHMGFEGDDFYLEINESLDQTFYLDHHEELLNEVTVHGSIHDQSSASSEIIGQEQIDQSGNQNLADIAGSISGVSVIKNGAGISKPVIHGLYGNRISILNNGVVQAGQQWGIDHAPEIDPFVADHISVVKGVAVLAYNSNAIGGLLMVEPGTINKDPHIHGTFNYGFQTNGRGHSLNTKIEKNGKWAAWRLTATGKILGDTHSPDYYLTNTGRKEINASLQIEKMLSKRWTLDTYISSFNTNIGILSGSHIGNLTDLEEAFERDEPLYTEDYFSYTINPPRQVVHHNLIKINAKHTLSDHQMLEIEYAGQINQRNEFDVRRSGRSDQPALSLQLISQYLGVKYDHTFANEFDLEMGLQNTYAENTNDNESTGTLPLIPDYYSNTTGFYVLGKREINKLFYEVGGRINYQNIEAVTITTTVPRSIKRYNHDFINYSVMAGLSYKLNEVVKSNASIALAQRSPEINELYSDGLHQGVSGIERGNNNLKNETVLNASFSVDLTLSDHLYIQTLGYYQLFQNYIYLNPQDEFELTIRGAFPVFNYDQTSKARISGADWTLNYIPSHQFKINVGYAIVRGQDISNNLPLLYIPADNLNSSIKYAIEKIGPFKQNSFQIKAKYTFEQTRYEEGQDYLAPPDSYFLLDLNLGTHVLLGKNTVDINIGCDNLLNTVYRDYLNRLRYFADEQGRNVNISLTYKF